MPQVYDQSLEEALLELGYDARGVAAVEGWQVDASLLRTWLRKLRGFCTHPQVGQLQNQRDKLAANGVLKSINEVLDVGLQFFVWGGDLTKHHRACKTRTGVILWKNAETGCVKRLLS